MPSALPASADSYQRLAAYLRGNSQAARQSPEEIAKHLDVPVDMVRAVFASVDAAAPVRAKKDRTVVVKKALSHVNTRFETVMGRPVLFIFITSLIGVVLMLLGWRFLPTGPESLFVRQALAAAVSIGVMMLHYLCYFHAGRGRVAFAGAGIVWVLAVVAFVVPLIQTSDLQFEATGGRVRAMLMLSVAVLVLCILYLGVGLTLSVLGAYARTVRAEREEAKLTRQELLQRLFQIEERLNSGGATVPKRGILEHPAVAALKHNPYVAAIALGITVALLRSLLLEVADVRVLNAKMQSDPKAMYLSAAGLLSMTGLGAAGLVGLISGKFRSALLTMAFYTIATFAITLIPLGPFGPTFLLDRPRADIITQLMLPLIVGLAAGMGAKVEARAANERLLQANDPAVLVAEMVEIQRRLNPDASMTHVLFVDVAGSTEMKAGADPLNIEFSFREFQKLVSSIGAKYGGRIHGTAGDGAAAEFPSAEAAYAAGVALQSDIEHFNATVNRLEKPFRIRVGLHSGTVAGELQHVEFASVIDIAAHVQDSAPVGGVALTGATAQLLADAKLLPLRYPVDGQDVFLALDGAAAP